MPIKRFELTKVERLSKQDAATEQELVIARCEYEAAAKELEGLVAAQEAAISRSEALRGAIDRPVPITAVNRLTITSCGGSAKGGGIGRGIGDFEGYPVQGHQAHPFVEGASCPIQGDGPVLWPPVVVSKLGFVFPIDRS